MTGRTRWEIAEHEFAMARFLAGAVACPRCGAAARTETAEAEPCRNPYTGDELKAPAHFQRLALAEEAS